MTAPILKLHPELLTEDCSVRQLMQDEVKNAAYTQRLLTRAAITVFEKLKNQPVVYDNLSALLTKNDKIFTEALRRALGKELAHEMSRLGAFESSIQRMLYLYRNDGILAETTVVQALYHTNPHRNFVVAKSFWDDFAGLSLDQLRFRDLYRGIGYIFFPTPLVDPQGTEYHDYYFVLADGPSVFHAREHGKGHDTEVSNEILLIGLIAKGGGISRILRVQIPTDQDMPISRYMAQYPETFVYSGGDKHTVESTFDLFSAQIVNILAYLATGKPDLTAFKNKMEYRGQGNTPTRKYAHLSNLDVELVGYNWLKMPSYSKDAWTVRAHLRWQRCGEGLTQVKLTQVKAHEKRRKSEQPQE